MNKLTGLTLEEKIKYADLDQDLKDQLFVLLDNRANKEDLQGELNESKINLDEDLRYISKQITQLVTHPARFRSKDFLEQSIKDLSQDWEEFQSDVRGKLAYHYEKINEIKESL